MALASARACGARDAHDGLRILAQPQFGDLKELIDDVIIAADAIVHEIVAIAASFCSEACLLAGHENIQIHGGIGFTWEYPAHLYYKRAKSSEFLFGDVAYHREILASEIGLGEKAAS